MENKENDTVKVVEAIESEEKVGKAPTPQLNQACITRREFEEKVDLRETTQGERYLTAMVINPTIKYALTRMFGQNGNQTVLQAAKSMLEAKRAIMRYMHDRYAAIPFQNYQQKMAVLEHDFNRVFRYVSSEQRVMNTFPVSAKYELAGKKHVFTPALTHECGDTIDVFTIKLGKSKFTQSGRKNEFNRDMALYEMILYGRARGFKVIRAHLLYLTREDDVADWSACEPSFFGGNGNNDITMSDIYNGVPNDLDKMMEEKIKMFKEGIEENAMPEDECAYCKYARICRQTLPPKRIVEDEPDTSNLTPAKKIEFSEKQEKIRTFDKGVLRVLATAGSGKTFSSMAHISYLIEQGVNPKKVLLVTFSNAGAKEMTHKLKKMLGYDPTEEKYGMKITTFHGLFYEIVKENWEMLGFGRKPMVLNAVQRYSKIADLLAKNPILEWKGVSFRNFSVKKGGFNDVGALVVISDIFSQIKKLGQDYTTIATYDINTYCDIPASAVQKVINLYGKYEDYCKKEGLIDFDDMELLAFKVIEANPEYLENRYTWSHSVIDEFQDTSEFQMEMVKRVKMLPTFESMMIVGDDDQSIYRFRGTSPEFILDFHNRINEQYILRTDTDVMQPKVRTDTIEDVVLDMNYRSHQEIIDLGCKMLEANEDKIEKDITAARGKGGFVLVRGHADKKRMLDWIVNSILAQHDHGVPWNDICVLAYKKSKLRDVADALTKAGIPSMMGAPEAMSENSRIDSILAFARVLLNTEDTLDAAQAAAALYYAEDTSTEIKFMHLPKQEIEERIQDVLDRVLLINEETNPKVQKEQFMQFVQDIYLDDEAVERFIEPFETLDYEDILKYCRDFTLYGANEEFRRLDEYPGVKLITAHSSKGLEWPIVYLDLTDFSDIKIVTLDEKEELRRLMYVSMTRARDQLFTTGVFSKTGKKVGEEVVNWCLSEAYDAAGLNWNADFMKAKAEVAAEKAAKKKAADEARKARAAAKRAEKSSTPKVKKATKKDAGPVPGQTSLF